MTTDEPNQIEFQCEVETAGLMLFDKVFKNEHTIFPKLNLTLLTERLNCGASTFP